MIEVDAKESQDDIEADYLVDEKGNTATITPRGVTKAEKYFGCGNLSDPENATLQHHINQAIKAHGCMKLDVDYVVKDGEIVIVDEFTGRLMFGRRYSEGPCAAAARKGSGQAAARAGGLSGVFAAQLAVRGEEIYARFAL